MPELLDINSEIGSMSSELLDELFKEGIEGTPGKDDLSLGKQTTSPDLIVDSLKDDEDLFDDESKTPEEIEAAKKIAEEKVKLEADKKLEEEKKANNAKKTPEELEAEEKLKLEKEAEEKATKDAEKNAPIIEEALTNTVDYLVKSGVWVDFEGREGLKITPEIYQELVVEQDKVRLNSQFDELLDSTGDYGKAIIAHIKQGGNPDDIIDIFKEQKQLEQIDTSTEEGKTIKIEKYYKEVLGWKDEKVQKHVKRLIADEEIEGEFTEVEELYNKHYQQQLQAIDREAKVEAKKAQDRKEEFKVNIKTALEKEDTLTPKERKLVEDSILNFKHDLGNGQKVNDFYIKFAELQKDPAKYIKLVRFVMDPENYEKAIKQVVETKEAVKAFKFIKGNGAVSKTSTVIDNKSQGGKSQGGTNFSFVRN